MENHLDKSVELIIASSNQHKIKEIKLILPSYIKLISANEIGFTEDIPETADTLEGNAKLKAHYINIRTKKNCFAEDTGLEVRSLNNEPGVHSARYAGLHRSSIDNMDKLLSALNNDKDRSAQFRTVICLIWNDIEYLFEGIVKGRITFEKRGEQGFGYDPIFIPEGYEESFAELSMDIKNEISHRRRAVEKMMDFLKNL